MSATQTMDFLKQYSPKSATQIMNEYNILYSHFYYNM